MLPVPASRPIETVGKPFAGATAGRLTTEDWRSLFASYPLIAIRSTAIAAFRP